MPADAGAESKGGLPVGGEGTHLSDSPPSGQAGSGDPGRATPPPRDLAALILATAFGIAVVVVVLGVYIPAVRFTGPGLSATGLDVTLTIIGALIGAVGTTLSRDLAGTRARVGLILAATLATVALVVVGFVLWDATSSSEPAISSNTGKVLATILGGILGALLGYLGLALPSSDDNS